MAAVLAVLLVARLVAGPGSGDGGAGPGESSSLLPASAYLYASPPTTPPLGLVDQKGRPFDPAVLSGGPTLVFFGYTHCPDVCPATMGILGQVATAYGSAMHVIFVTVDPERDTVAWLAEYLRYLPAGFSALTGTAAQVKTAADGWGVRYARVETGTPGQYSMSHTAEVYLIDGAGQLRAHFPFGTNADAILATVRLVTGSGAPPAQPTAPPASPGPAATPSPLASPAASVRPLTGVVESSSVWAGGASPVILSLSGPDGRLADTSAVVTVQVRTNDGRAELRQTVQARAVRPPGVPEVSYVAVLDIPSPGWWQLAIKAETRGTTLAGTIAVPALDPGGTARLGVAAPTVRTPNLDDAGGVALRITTDPLPDLRLSKTSTSQALSGHQPFVLIVDSARFKVTPACGKALNLAKYLVDRWPSVAFIHLEPYVYDVITDTAVIRGSLGSPTLVPAADAWGAGSPPWGAGSMPWAFVVDQRGVVRAKYQGVVGSDDLDVILSMLAAGG